MRWRVFKIKIFQFLSASVKRFRGPQNEKNVAFASVCKLYIVILIVQTKLQVNTVHIKRWMGEKNIIYTFSFQDCMILKKTLCVCSSESQKCSAYFKTRTVIEARKPLLTEQFLKDVTDLSVSRCDCLLFFFFWGNCSSIPVILHTKLT